MTTKPCVFDALFDGGTSLPSIGRDRSFLGEDYQQVEEKEEQQGDRVVTVRRFSTSTGGK